MRLRGGYEAIDEEDDVHHERIQDPEINAEMMPAARNTVSTY